MKQRSLIQSSARRTWFIASKEQEETPLIDRQKSVKNNPSTPLQQKQHKKNP